MLFSGLHIFGTAAAVATEARAGGIELRRDLDSGAVEHNDRAFAAMIEECGRRFSFP